MKTFSINRIMIAAIAVLFSTFIFTSCQKESSLNTSTEVTEAEATELADESLQVEASFDDAEDVAMIAAEEEGNAGGFGIEGRTATAGRIYLPAFLELRARIGDCATITVTPNDSTYPKTVTIDFGNGCTGLDGKFRSGKLVLHFTAPVRRPGAVVTLTFVDYHVNRKHIEGTKIFKNLSEPGTHKWSVEVINGKVTFPNGRGYAYDRIKTVTQIAGGLTNIIRDDVYKITGRSKTVFNNGTIVNINTEDPLIKKMNCPWISEGTLKIKINNRVFKLDFGFPNNGDCDNKALLTWNNGNDQRVILL
ncbi:MAG TPA: hypothetical protein VGO58_17845 [Chitinophagaceae bacterium]|jgi:hypothetical protein|nr:hypothetical protein [Chitinophagaceae bacterium]